MSYNIKRTILWRLIRARLCKFTFVVDCGKNERNFTDVIICGFFYEWSRFLWNLLILRLVRKWITNERKFCREISHFIQALPSRIIGHNLYLGKRNISAIRLHVTIISIELTRSRVESRTHHASSTYACTLDSLTTPPPPVEIVVAARANHLSGSIDYNQNIKAHLRRII